MSMLAYYEDFYGWRQEQARLLMEHRINELDLENQLEEIESMGISKKRELELRLEKLLIHLLKWQYQPNCHGKSLELTIREQRTKNIRHLNENPSLKAQLAEIFEYSYEDARMWSARETGLSLEIFPASCPWAFEQVIEPEFFSRRLAEQKIAGPNQQGSDLQATRERRKSQRKNPAIILISMRLIPEPDGF